MPSEPIYLEVDAGSPVTAIGVLMACLVLQRRACYELQAVGFVKHVGRLTFRQYQ